MVEGIEQLFDKSEYPDTVVDAVCPLLARPCTMVPIDAIRFPSVAREVDERFGSGQHADVADDPMAVNERLLEDAEDVERHVARSLWQEILDPCLEGLSSEIVAVPYRDTMFESAVYRDRTLDWKLEAYLYTEEDASSTVAAVRQAKRAYLRSLERGLVPTAESKRHELEEIRMKGELLDYPSCCRRRFRKERRARFDTLLELGDDRITELRREAETSEKLAATFADEVEGRDRSMRELNPERRIIDQLERLDLAAYFEGWSYERLRSFFERKSRTELPSFFYAFSTEEFYPHRPRCESATELGRRVESGLEERYPALLGAYRAEVVLNLFSYLGFDDRRLRRRLLADIATVDPSEDVEEAR